MTQQKNKKKLYEVSGRERIKSFVYSVVRQISVSMLMRFIESRWWEDV
jgi:hypothetical protein